MSVNRPWYKRYPKDFIHGTMGLSLEEKGAYSLILDLIYDKGAPIIDDARYLAGICNVSLRKWMSLRESLIAAKKISISDGFISNFRAEKEIENVAKFERKLSESGAKGGRKRAENEHEFNKNSNLSQATLKHTRAKDTDTDIDIKKDISNDISKKRIPKKPPPETRGCRLPINFEPNFSIAYSEGFTEPQAAKLFECFKDYWSAKTGKDATKLDWQATWRNWVRNSHRFSKNNFSPQRSSVRPTPISAVSSIVSRFYDDEQTGKNSSDKGDWSDVKLLPSIAVCRH